MSRRRSPLDREIATRILEEYRRRVDVLRGKAEMDETDQASESHIDRSLQKEALAAERQTIAELRHAGEIPDEIYRSIEYDLDLEALRLS